MADTQAITTVTKVGIVVFIALGLSGSCNKKNTECVNEQVITIRASYSDDLIMHQRG